MLPLNELKKYAFVRRLTTLEQIRKDYAHDIVLFLLYKESPKFVFKGGTCLWKLFKLPRFSEDIDLSLPERIEFLGNVTTNMGLLGFEVEVLKERTTKNTLFSKIHIEAPSFGSTQVPIQIGFRPEKWEEREFQSPYPDVPDFQVRISPLEEIIKSKINAIINRDKPRDVFDLYFLVTRYKSKYQIEDLSEFERGIESKRKLWKSLEPLIIVKLPEFNIVKEKLLSIK